MEAVSRAWIMNATGSQRFAARLEREAPWLGVLALYAALILAGLPRLLAPDSWLAFVAGRELVDSGLPSRDHLTTWAAGAQWVDQQWLGHLLIYAGHTAGGMRSALLGNAVILVTALALAGAYARRRHASPGSIAAVLLATMLVAAPNTALRTETLVYPLFICLVWLLAADARRPSARVLLVLPLLLVWANLHGSVLLAASLAALRGLLRIVERTDRQNVAISIALLLSPLTVLASPYGFSVITYFGRTVGRSAFPDLLVEWQPTSFPGDWRFFTLAFVATWLIARSRELTTFERATFVVLLVGGLVARRYVVWLALFLAMVLPGLLGREWRRGSLIRPRTTNVLAGAAAVAVLAAFTVVAMRPAERLESSYPEKVEHMVARELAQDPSLKVFASELYADWLLFEVPTSRGRIAYDTRFELLSDDRLRDLIRFNNLVDGWRSVTRGHRLFVLETGRHRHVIAALAAEPGARRLYSDTRVTVVRRGDRSQL